MLLGDSLREDLFRRLLFGVFQASLFFSKRDIQLDFFLLLKVRFLLLFEVLEEFNEIWLLHLFFDFRHGNGLPLSLKVLLELVDIVMLFSDWAVPNVQVVEE